MKTTNLKKIFITALSAVFAACFIAGISAIFPHQSAFAAESGANCTILSDAGIVKQEYLDEYSYKTQGEGVHISEYSANGGNYGSNYLSKAFDGDPSTFWESSSSNSQNFVNYVTLTFSAQAQADRIVYMPRTDSYPKRGYPLTFTVYASDAESGEDFTKICEVSSTYSGNRVIYDLGGIYSFRRLRLEFTKINSDISQQLAAAAELIILQPEEEAARAVRSAFADYSCLTLKDEFKKNAEQLISAAKNTVAYSCSTQLSMLTDRAEAVLSGKAQFDLLRELSTADGAENPITRAGDVAGYARNSLKMVWMGTNRQVTGIGAAGGETLTVFVEAEEGDPLPSIVCTQFMGTWQGWRSGTIALSRGINFITVPDYYQDWSNTVSGGPIYIVNPYTPDQQSDKVKVYIEGGYTFPVYRENDDEEDYVARLESYLDKVAEKPDYLADMTEITNDNVILTVTASQALKQYKTNGYSPASALGGWKDYLRSLYSFCGVYDEKYYDERAEYLNVNIRVMQSLAGAAAYAYTEHVGIYAGSDWELTCLRGSNFGWGVTHELGHMMDISERTWTEYTNNMWSQYNKCALAGEEARGNFSAFLSSTVKDGVPYSERDAYSKRTDAAITWWLIESRYPGYWGRLENNYRYADRAGITNKAELHVYFSSLAAGADLSYYFERIGFNWGGNTPFEGYETASQQFKSAISAALSSGQIKEEGLKLWYLDAGAYNYTIKYGDALKVYDATEKVSFTLGKSTGGITLLMEGATDYRHLGYEILRGNETDGYSVIGFTYARSFTDPSPEEGQSYKVRAYDRALGCSALSAALSYNGGAVARADGKDYSTLSEAVEAASDGATVYLLSDAFAAGITVDKNITIAPASSECTIYLSSASAMFTVKSGAQLTISGADFPITLNGAKISKSQALIVSDGVLSLSGNVTLTENVSTSNGGAIRISSGTLNIGEGVKFSGNSAASGGAIASQAGGNATLNISGAIFSENSASSDGGAIYANSFVNLTNCVFSANTAKNGGAACIYGGGVLTVESCSFENNFASSQGGALKIDGKTSFAGSSYFNGNSANQGGGIYVASGNSARRAVISSAEFANNSAEYGGAVYVGGYAAFGVQNATLKISAPLSGSTALYVAQNANLSEFAGTADISGGVAMFAPLALSGAFNAAESSLNVIFAFGGEGNVLITSAADCSQMSLRSFAETDGGVYAAEYSADGLSVTVGSARAYKVSVSGGTHSSSEYFLSGESFTLPDAQAPEGYVFKGWQCGGKVYAAGQTVEITSDMSFEALFESITTDPDEPDPDNPDPDNPDGGDSEEPSDGVIPAWVYAVIAGAAVIVFAAVVTIVIYVRSSRRR